MTRRTGRGDRRADRSPSLGALRARIVEVGDLDGRERDAMFGLMDRFYADVERRRFQDDLNRKRWCVLVEGPNGRLRGFSTQVLLDTEVDGCLVRSLFSGDTIVEREAWGSPALLAAFARLALHLIDRHRNEPLYWFLTTQGFRTYRLLPLFYRSFYPRCDEPTPAWARTLIDALASRWFPEGYLPDRRIIRPTVTYRLRAGVADVSSERLRNRHIRYFHERNPGHADGDELCCIARLSRENFSAATWRVVQTAPFAAVRMVEEGRA